MKHHDLTRRFVSTHGDLWQARCGYVLIPTLNGPYRGPHCTACAQFKAAAEWREERTPSNPRDRLMPYIGRRVVVKFHPLTLERIEAFDAKVASKWVNGRVGVLSDVGERRAFFDLQTRGPGRDKSWDVPIKGVFSIEPAPWDSTRDRRIT